MSFRRIMALAACGLAELACGDDRPAPARGGAACTDCPDAGAAGGQGGSSGSGGTAGTDSRAGNAGSLGLGGQETDGGDGQVAPPPPECGNGVREADEACDGSDFGELHCPSFGFSDGALACGACAVDAAGCSGTEVCSDGNDNDGDTEIDCADADCSEACANFCAAPTPLPDAALVTGRILAQLSPVDSSCSPESTTGQVVFVYESPLAGVAEVFVVGAELDFTLSARTSCEQVNSELACTAGVSGLHESVLRLPVALGDTLYLVVESPDRDVASAFQLFAVAHEVTCGDGHVDSDEECDDGNFAGDDGCSEVCEFRTDEVEPNTRRQDADAYVAPSFFGEISSPSDVDTVVIEVGAGQKLIAETFDVGDDACERYELDNLLEVLDEAGTLVASNDDQGMSFCAALVTEPLMPGTYYVRVRASGVTASFLYQLSLRLEN